VRIIMQVYEFGPFCLNVPERLLLKNGQMVPLKAKVFELLLLLVQKEGHLVRKEELMKAVWPDSFVEDNNLTVGISSLRKALGERPRGPQYIETVPRVGYRFIGDLRVCDNSQPACRGCAEKPADSAAKARPHWLHSGVGPLAVLPFEVLGSEAVDRCLSIGIADMLVTKLCRLGRVNVLPTRCGLEYLRDRSEPGEGLPRCNVNSLLEGQLQMSGNKIRVTVQIISTSDQRLLWADKYDGEYTDAFGVQDFISDQVARALGQGQTGGSGPA
jgi:DNA-binding winged helix-turn-helix (wHTH) protein